MLQDSANQRHTKLIHKIRDIRNLSNYNRDRLLDTFVFSRSLLNTWLKYQVLVNRRTDILAKEILGYEVIPTIHKPIICHQARHPQNLVLAFRGAGKTTIATISDAIMSILQNPNVRILIASKTLTNAQDFLKEIKGHFENNAKFREIFGNWVGRNQWDERSIEVAQRTIVCKEPTVMTVGVDGAVASKHYDILYPDDLVEEENSRTEYMRNRLKKWYYSILLPCLEPPDITIPERGRNCMSGTRYHPDDLYAYMSKNEMENSTLIVPAINHSGESNWEKKFPIDFLTNIRDKQMGTVIFNAQYQCDCDAMKGEIFQYDHFQRHSSDEYPSLDSMKIYQGVDLAIGEKETNDLFAQVVLGVKDDHYWILEYEESRLRFNEQTSRILNLYRKYDPIWCGVEINAYQRAQLQNLKDKHSGFRGIGITTLKDKITRAWKLTAISETGRFHFKESHNLLIERLVSFSPDAKHKDLFDALDMAVTVSNRRKKRKRTERKNFGLM